MAANLKARVEQTEKISRHYLSLLANTAAEAAEPVVPSAVKILVS